MAGDDPDVVGGAVSAEQVEVEPWYAVWSEDGTWPGQAERHAEIARRCSAEIGDRVFLAQGAWIACESLRIGDRSYVAAGCVLRDRLTIGEDCSLNPHVVAAGRVHLGDGVRIASFAALYGFNHRFDDLEAPIWLQPLDEVGIEVGEDVWIGTHAVICDGVRVGAHAVIAAGAVVTADVPAWSVVAGVPARVRSDRRDLSRQRDVPHDERTGSPRTTSGRSGRVGRAGDALARLDARVSAQCHDVLARCRTDDDHGVAGYVDTPGEAWHARPTCDAIEIAAAFGDVGAAGDIDTLAGWLASLQDPATGLFLDPTEPPLGEDPLALRLDGEFAHYGVISAGHALELVGRHTPAPVRVVDECDGGDLIERLDALPWATLGWPAGSWVDFVATATYLNQRHHGSPRGIETLLGWLSTRVDPFSGMWSPPDATWGRLMAVNGFYRLVRGTYAQFGVPLPHPEAVIDTVAAHARDNAWFTDRNRSACNVLDVVHPLWLAARQSDHRRDELADAVAGALVDTAGRWVDGEGFAFAPDQSPGLQGTEMWLSVVWLMARYLDVDAGLSWLPRGVHRPEPVTPRRSP